MVNLFHEIISMAIMHYAIDTNDSKLIIVDKGEQYTFDLNNKDDFERLKEKYSFEYDDGFGAAEVTDLQIIIDDSSWLERHSYDGSESFVLKAHPINSKYTTEESHMG